MEILTYIASQIGGLVSYIVPFLFVLTVVVFVHEFGHFSIARLCRTKVDTFSIGFGKEIFGWYDRHGTRWKVSWLPLGGFVKFFGDENAASAPDKEALEKAATRMTEEERAGCFHFKPVPQRAAIVAAGPFANFILAIVIFAIMAMTVGEIRTPTKVGGVISDSPAAHAGLQPGDVIKRINNKRMRQFSDLQNMINMNAGVPLSLLVQRDDKKFELVVTPEEKEVEDGFGDKYKVGLIGVHPQGSELGDIEPNSAAARAGLRKGDLVEKVDSTSVSQFYDILAAMRKKPGQPVQLTIERGGKSLEVTVTPDAKDVVNEEGKTETVGVFGAKPRIYRYGPVAALGQGVDRTWMVIDRTMVFLGRLFTGREDAGELGGPVRIAQLSGEVAKLGIVPLIQLAGFLSVSIGLINLFPIPMLDGGHLVYYLVEAVKGSPLSAGAQELGFKVGLVIVLGVMIFATVNDLLRLTG